ncbi:unnamed protein product [Sphagnum jensenii]|uniref:Senescence domain-containing protein n=1 Tax=Sphagnum jensenii TaxID=128206 RepID=A0ABP1AA46_9BRYO
MEWFKKQIGVGGGGNDGLASFIVGSDKWMGSTAKYNKEDEASTSYYQPPPLEDNQLQSSSSSCKSSRTNAALPVSEDVLSETLRSQSMGESLVKYPTIDATYATPWRTDAASGQLVAEEPTSATPLRSQSVGASLREVRYPTVDPYAPDSSDARVMNSSSHLDKLSFYPEIYQGGEQQEEEEQLFEADVPPGKEEEVESREECLVTVPGAIVYLIDDEQSIHLATAHFSIVRITQKGNGIVVLVRVGNDLHWPLMKDVPVVKLDPTHYFFSVPVPLVVDHSEGDTKNSKHNSRSGQNESEVLNYGVTFPVAGHEKALEELDTLLGQYTCFSSPTLVHGDKQKEKFLEKSREAEGLADLPVVSKEHKMQVTEQNQAAFWTTMAPNVDDYGSSAARMIATGSGQIIRGIFWIRDSTVAQLESGSIYVQGKIKPNAQPSNISPRTLRNLQRVRYMSKATENVAKGVLYGIVKTAGFFSGAVITSSVGKKFFRLMPGEVALVSLDAFAKLFDALEKATTDVLQSTSLMTQNVVAHRYGEPAGKVTEETLATAGHVVATAWTVSKLRKALNPKEGIKPTTKTAFVKSIAKNVITGGKK